MADTFLPSYEAGKLASFFSLAPGDTETALKLERPVNRPALQQALQRYAETLAAPAAVHAAIAQLEHPQSRAVVTGQQVGVLLGPHYSLSKAVNAISLAKQLSRDDAPVIPVFWLASQDHDSEEINHNVLLDLEEQLHHVRLELPQGVAAGRIAMRESWLHSLVDSLQQLKAPASYVHEAIALLEHSAAKATTIADWFAAMLYALLGDQGLVVVNPLEPDIAPLFASVLAREIRCPRTTSLAINHAADRLKALHLPAQLGRAEDASNVFLEENGQRQLLRIRDDGFVSDVQHYSPEQLLSILEQDPSRLTPAAGLRPVCQDVLLPTAVTVVGPGELRYFAQLREVYRQHDVAMPLIWPRMQVTVLEPPVRRILDKFNLDPQAWQADPDGQRHALLLELHGHAQHFQHYLDSLEEHNQALLQHVRAIDASLEDSVARGAQQLRSIQQRLQRQSAAALTKQDNIYTQQLQRLDRHLLPQGTPQERILSPFSFFVKFGVRNHIQALLELPVQGQQALRY